MLQKFYLAILLCCCIFINPLVIVSNANEPIIGSLELTQQELDWIQSHKNQPLMVGLDPYSGMDYFLHNDKLYGYLIDVVNIFEEETGLDLIIDDEKNWGQAYDGLYNGSIDILFGANPTPERLKTMSFTDSVHRYPYTALALSESEVRTIGDFDGKIIGFLDGDMIVNEFNTIYKNITYSSKLYPNQEVAIQAMINGEIAGFITSGGEVVYEYLYRFPEIKSIAEIKNVYSEMTFSTLIENKTLAGILDKIIKLKSFEIQTAITKARVNYIRKVLKLSKEELAWLESNIALKVGIPTDYLPIDYYDGKAYTGVAGEYFTGFSTMVGLNIECVPQTFDILYQKMISGEIDVLDMAKTEDRLSLFNFTKPFSTDRDVIYGLKEAPTVYDIYGLENARVAIINGFWHEEYLKKNLKHVDMVFTQDIKETLQKISNHQVDYFLENPSVAEYYIEGLGYSKIVRKGNTSADSFLYFGCQKKYPEFISIFNKATKLLDYEKAKYEGIQKAPALNNVQNSKLTKIILLILASLLVVTLFLIKIFNDLIIQKAKTKRLKEREHLIYTDALTGLHNRLYFNALEKKMSDHPFPQSFIMIDLNHLKSTNDTYGHHIGDLLIQAFADILKSLVPSDRVMRMGGDEFFIFLENSDDKATREIIDEIKDNCDKSVVKIAEDMVIRGLIPSIGYCIRKDVSLSPDAALQDADQKMYMDKQLYHQSFN